MGVIINELYIEAVGPGSDGPLAVATEAPDHPPPSPDHIDRINRQRHQRRARLEPR